LVEIAHPRIARAQGTFHPANRLIEDAGVGALHPIWITSISSTWIVVVTVEILASERYAHTCLAGPRPAIDFTRGRVGEYRILASHAVGVAHVVRARIAIVAVEILARTFGTTTPGRRKTGTQDKNK